MVELGEFLKPYLAYLLEESLVFYRGLHVVALLPHVLAHRGVNFQMHGADCVMPSAFARAAF